MHAYLLVLDSACELAPSSFIFQSLYLSLSSCLYKCATVNLTPLLLEHSDSSLPPDTFQYDHSGGCKMLW